MREPSSSPPRTHARSPACKAVHPQPGPQVQVCQALPWDGSCSWTMGQTLFSALHSSSFCPWLGAPCVLCSIGSRELSLPSRGCWPCSPPALLSAPHASPGPRQWPPGGHHHPPLHLRPLPETCLQCCPLPVLTVPLEPANVPLSHLPTKLPRAGISCRSPARCSTGPGLTLASHPQPNSPEVLALSPTQSAAGRQTSFTCPETPSTCQAPPLPGAPEPLDERPGAASRGLSSLEGTCPNQRCPSAHRPAPMTTQASRPELQALLASATRPAGTASSLLTLASSSHTRIRTSPSWAPPPRAPRFWGGGRAHQSAQPKCRHQPACPCTPRVPAGLPTASSALTPDDPWPLLQRLLTAADPRPRLPGPLACSIAKLSDPTRHRH